VYTHPDFTQVCSTKTACLQTACLQTACLQTAAAAAAAAYSRSGSTNHGIFLITLCFADSVEEPYDSPIHHHGSSLQTVRSQSHAVHARHDLSGMRGMYNTKGMQSCYFSHCISRCSVRTAYQLSAVADIICSLCSL